MTFIVKFRDYRPSGRDAALWTNVLIQQADVTADTGEPGTWTDIDTKVIPPYPDSTEPPYFSFETDQGTLAPGWYRVIFRDASSDQEITAPRLYRGGATYRPSTKAVAVHIKNRTVDAHNKYIGDFTSETEVTASEVEELISKAENRVLRRLDLDPNVPIPTESQEAITDLVALFAAMLVELTKYSEQVATKVSPYAELKALFDEQLIEIREDVTGIVDGGGTGGGVTGSGMAHFSFPDDINQVSWTTQF